MTAKTDATTDTYCSVEVVPSALLVPLPEVEGETVVLVPSALKTLT